MEYTLNEQLIVFLNNFNAKDINDYFGANFSEDYDRWETEKIDVKVLEFLNEEFINIDNNLEIHNTPEFDIKVKKTLEKALEILNNQTKQSNKTIKTL